MEALKNTLKFFFKNYSPLLKAILTLKKNKLFKNTRIKSIKSGTLVINALDYTTFSLLNSNKQKILRYLQEVFENSNIKIENLKVINTPEIKNLKNRGRNIELISKIKQIRRELYGDK